MVIVTGVRTAFRAFLEIVTSLPLMDTVIPLPEEVAVNVPP